MKKILFATSNGGKLLEAEKFLSPLGYEIEHLNISYPEIQSSKLEEVAAFGIEWILKEEKVKGSVMIEDAGLFVHALNDFPGVFSADTFKTIGLDGILRLMEGEEDRAAHFESCIAYCEKESEPMFFKGRVDGKIALEPKGEHGFGYDPIFIPKGEEKTFGEMEAEEKNRHSHRGKSLKKMVEHLAKR
ncbi:MAG: XTP/dITP diphosphatase [Thermoplasmata archaeon]|nr:MAG: XTP/dITP diphosphatase [Thermoplasmata archaeon]